MRSGKGSGKAAPKVIARARRTGKPKPKGQKVVMTAALANVICERIATGESLRAICATAGMPGITSVYKWLSDPEHAAFAEQYARARDQQADYYADEIIEIADSTKRARKHVQVEAARTRIDARKWLASKLRPKSYGDKVQADVVVRRSAQELSDDELAAHIITGRGGTADPPKG